jgi:farnesyl-diphosphate farnesyltransferase
LGAVTDPREKQLLESTPRIFEELRQSPDAEARLVREVCSVIVSGQRLDLERFADASRENPLALADAAALEDYTWRVAGCVGEFWTHLGFLTLEDGFSDGSPSEMLARGRTYGKGLQLVNILRDLAEDLEQGRCYLPVADPTHRESLMACHRQWATLARAWVAEGNAYAQCLPSRRLRAATVLPALIAEKTLDLLEGATWESLQQRAKVPRSQVYSSLLRAFFSSPG